MYPARKERTLRRSETKERIMSAAHNKEFLQRYATALMEKGKGPEILSQFVDSQDLRDHIAMLEEAFPGYQLTVDDVVAENDRVTLRGTFKGRHQGTFQGMPATGREVSFLLMAIYRIVNERIVDFWMSADTLSLLQQLGAVPQREAAPTA
jgi:predicted ester cyclase